MLKSTKLDNVTKNLRSQSCTIADNRLLVNVVVETFPIIYSRIAETFRLVQIIAV